MAYTPWRLQGDTQAPIVGGLERVSTDAGLQPAFNALDAAREPARAHVARIARFAGAKTASTTFCRGKSGYPWASRRSALRHSAIRLNRRMPWSLWFSRAYRERRASSFSQPSRLRWAGRGRYCEGSKYPSMSVLRKATTASSSASFETEVPGLGGVEIGRLLRLRPAIDADRLFGALAVGKDVAGVVEMHDRLQVGEIAVMHVGALEAGAGTLATFRNVAF